MVAPAPLRNHTPTVCHALFSIKRLTAAVELPAITIGRQCPTANSNINKTCLSG